MAKARMLARPLRHARRRVLPPPSTVQAYRTKAEVAADVIRGAIFGGELPPGAELTVLGLAQRFGLTLMPLREARHFRRFLHRQDHSDEFRSRGFMSAR